MALLLIVVDVVVVVEVLREAHAVVVTSANTSSAVMTRSASLLAQTSRRCQFDLVKESACCTSTTQKQSNCRTNSFYFSTRVYHTLRRTWCYTKHYSSGACLANGDRMQLQRLPNDHHQRRARAKHCAVSITVVLTRRLLRCCAAVRLANEGMSASRSRDSDRSNSSSLAISCILALSSNMWSRRYFLAAETGAHCFVVVRRPFTNYGP